jgi:hypothetical protein
MLADPVDSTAFFGRVWHPDFNFDVDDSEVELERFKRHVKAVEESSGVRKVDECVGRVREDLRGDLVLSLFLQHKACA